MKILVCISKTPDTTAKIAFTDNNRKFVTDGVQWILNPYDEWYALVRAIEIKEKDPSAVLHLVNVGGPDCDVVIRSVGSATDVPAASTPAKQQTPSLPSQYPYAHNASD